MLGVWKVSYQRKKKKKKNGKRFLVLVLVKSASPPRTSLLYHPSLSLLIPLFNQIHTRSYIAIKTNDKVIESKWNSPNLINTDAFANEQQSFYPYKRWYDYHRNRANRSSINRENTYTIQKLIERDIRRNSSGLKIYRECRRSLGGHWAYHPTRDSAVSFFFFLSGFK